MTSDINDWRSITVFPGEEVGKRWRAPVHVFRRDRLDTPDRVEEEFVGFGPTMNSARGDAYRQAKRFVLSQGQPSDWEGRFSCRPSSNKALQPFIRRADE